MATATSPAPASPCQLPCRPSTCPSWLQAALADIEERVRALAVTIPDGGEGGGHSFAERAEDYYQRRPQLLALLHDLHRQYLYLADRYSQSVIKSHRLPLSAADARPDDGDDPSEYSSAASDAESSLSFQLPPIPFDPPSRTPDLEILVAELVAVSVERDILAAEADEAERRRKEAARKIELQGSLLEVLESERIVLLGENARLGFRAAAAEEKAAVMVAELGYVRRRAADLARLVVKLREEHRVCVLGRRIEGLQAQLYALERRNRECFEAMAEWEAEQKAGRAELERLREENRRLAAAAAARGTGGAAKWWGRVRKTGWAPCVPHVKGGKGGCFCL